MAVILRDFTSDFPPDVNLALVIAGEPVTGTKGQRHAGFVVSTLDGRLLLFDLAWHNIYRCSEITPEYACLVAECLDPFAANAIIGFLVTLYSVNDGRLPYGIKYEDGEYFDRDSGRLLKTGLGQGLTCATFVLEVLKRYGLKIIDKSTWSVTNGDKVWQEGMLEKLIENTMPPNSIDDFLAQFDFIGEAKRFKPEEVLGAANYFEGQPLGFDVVSPAADEVISELRRLGLDELKTEAAGPTK